MKNTTAIGQIGESLARKYLENKGYQVIEQNYRTKYAEIDLVVKKQSVLIFVEVRTKKGQLFGSPEETINRQKLKKLELNAAGYVARKKWKGPYRIDAICVVLNSDNKVARIEHYQDII